MKYLGLLIASICIMNTNAFCQKKKKKYNKGYQIGSIASDFSLLNVDGKMVSLKDFENAKGFVICFTCNHCPFSIANEDRLIELNNNYNKRGYPLIAINPNDPKVNEDDSYEKMIERAEQKNFTFPYLFDKGQEVFPLYGATKTPHIYLLQKTDEGLEVKYIGAIDDSARNPDEVEEKYLENAINALLQNKEIERKETKAIGCSIKVAKTK